MWHRSGERFWNIEKELQAQLHENPYPATLPAQLGETQQIFNEYRVFEAALKSKKAERFQSTQDIIDYTNRNAQLIVAELQTLDNLQHDVKLARIAALQVVQHMLQEKLFNYRSDIATL
jgi:vacuolar-type H+-ATPase catalytic subunit A/Vma1